MIYKYTFPNEYLDLTVISKLLYTVSSLEPLDANLCGRVIGIDGTNTLIFRIIKDALAKELIWANAPIEIVRQGRIIRHFAFTLEHLK